MMIFLSLRVTADAVGGLKGPAQLRRSLRGLGGGSHQQASAGIYRRIACRYQDDRKALAIKGAITYQYYRKLCALSPISVVSLFSKTGVIIL